MIRLLLADDHAIFLQGLTRLLDAWPEVRIVAKAADGHRCMSPTVSENLHAFRLSSGGVTLSPREREVLKLVASGLSSKAIARTLDISPKTVETHRSRLMTKLDLHSVADLVRYAVETGFLSK